MGKGFFKLELPNVFEKIFSVIRKICDSFGSVIKKFSVSRSLEVHENWRYRIDPETSIAVLEVERDPNAINKTRNALRDLFQ